VLPLLTSGLKLPSKKKSRLRTAKVLSSPNGKGVYAQKSISKDSVVGQVRGEITTDDELDPRYLMDLDGGKWLRPTGTFRYLNHSCNPNCELFVWEDQPLDASAGTRPLFVGALRAIPKGTQLTIDYQWTADFAIPCHCGSKNCRGWIVDSAELKKLKKSKKLRQ
jgi:hypothetical protein